MKGLKPFFAGTLAFLGIWGAWADDTGDIARAAVRRGTTNTVSASRTTPRETSVAPVTSQKSDISRNTTLTPAAPIVRERTTTSRPSAIVRGISTTRDATTVQPRTTPATTTVSRTATVTRTPTGSTTPAVRTTASRTATRTPATRTTSRAATQTRTSRAATISDSITADDIINKDYKKCREVYYSCMDEFCANKDAQLKRCACSSRVNEFDRTRDQLANVEDKMLDFSQRLLTVNMEKEDAAALFTATEGENAFNQTDRSQSKQMLDEIAKKLNTSFDDSSFDQGLGAISYSLNMDAAFDTVDSLGGASTTAKTGVALYNAALPVCRAMAQEVCSTDEITIVEGGYLMTIEQDCTTVAKSYQTQTDQAREKVREGSALLDMSRLDIHQKRNSDDILTCKTKMLDMLTDTTVCGKNLTKCLDTSGRYIDPSTGEAFLTTDLSNLGNLITRPTANQTWTSAPNNSVFVTFLNSKKKFLAPAMEQCQDISDYVWDAFIEDALAQIKLAQDSKLEEVRQSCTTLTTQCLDESADSLAKFDARALSTFGVTADKTVNAMCAAVKNACTALLRPADMTDTDVTDDWTTGMDAIATAKTYDAIMKTCREVGRNCIIQACTSVSGNFGLCENIQTSINRKSIINRSACWNEVKQCVADAGVDAIDSIMVQLAADQTLNSDGNFYNTLYGESITVSNSSAPVFSSSTNYVYDFCTADGECTDPASTNCHICRLTEKIWGNCELAPTYNLASPNAHNRIKIPPHSDTDTLLSWFAHNTGTKNEADSCRDTTCGIGYIAITNETDNTITCTLAANLTSDGAYCPVTEERFEVAKSPSITACCAGGVYDTFGNCCTNGAKTNTDNAICVPQGQSDQTTIFKYMNLSGSVGLPSAQTQYSLHCLGTLVNTDSDPATEFPSGQELRCDGQYILISQRGHYISPTYTDSKKGTPLSVANSYQIASDSTTKDYIYSPTSTAPTTQQTWAWRWQNETGQNETGLADDKIENWNVTYGKKISN